MLPLSPGSCIFPPIMCGIVSRWSDPPYGGQTPYLEKFPEEKCAKEGRYILTPEEERRQGEIGIYSDPVFQRRLMILAGECCFIWDYEEAEEEHCFNCFYHPFGTAKMKGLEEKGFSEYLDTNPFGSGQFIRSCHWYEGKGSVELAFENRQKHVNPNDIMDFAEKVRLYGIYPQEGEAMMGRYPHRQDTFAPGENCGIKDLDHNPCKKAVAFRQVGKRARFITALEMGEESIHEIICRNYERVEILKKDGSRWEIAVEGMDNRTGREIRVSYQEMR